MPAPIRHYLIILARNSGRGDTYRFQPSLEENPEETLAYFLESGWFRRHGHNYWKVTLMPVDAGAAIGRHLN